MITKLKVEHYKSIQSLELALQQVNVLVGPNSAGKSNIIDTIKLVRDALRNGLDQAITERHGLNSIRQWAPTKPYHIKIVLEIEPDANASNGGGTGSFAFTLGSRGDEYIILHEEASWSETRRLRMAAETHTVTRGGHYLRDRNGFARVYTHRTKRTERLEVDNVDDFFLNSRYAYEFGSLRSRLADFESYTIFPNTLREPQKASNELHLSAHGDNLTSVIKRMRNKKRSAQVSEIIDAMKLVIPNLDNITIQSIGGFLTPQFRMIDREEKRTYPFNVNQMSDGTLRVLGILTALYQEPRPAILALEEPELTVHPGMLQLIADSIMEVSEISQILVTTHSPDLIDRFDPSSVIAVELKDDATTAQPLSGTQIEAVKKRLFSLGELMSVEGLHG